MLLIRRMLAGFAGWLAVLGMATPLLGQGAPGQEISGQESPATASPLPRPLRPLNALGVNTEIPMGRVPREYSAPQLAKQTDGASPATLAALQRDWPLVDFYRVASGSRSFPLYFEEVNAERYGYTCSRVFQPAISAVHFFGTIPYLPYLMAADCPRECVYTLGHYRPGNCNPWRAHSFPYRCDSTVVEGAAIAGLIFLIP